MQNEKEEARECRSKVQQQSNSKGIVTEQELSSRGIVTEQVWSSRRIVTKQGRSSRRIVGFTVENDSESKHVDLGGERRGKAF